MMKLSKALMLSVSGLIFTSNGSAASIHNLTSFNSPGAVTFVHTPYTHTSHPEEMLLSSAFYPLPENSGRDREGFKPTLTLPKSLGREEKRQGDKIKLAATCFVTDTSACSGNEFGGNNADDDGHGAPGGPSDGDDYDLDNAERCRQEGYTQTSCPEGQEPSNACPYDSNYFEKCVSSCPSNYVTCDVPYYGVGETCDGKYASCEKDTERACQELNPGYVDECGAGQQLSSDRCSYDSLYGTCCNTCEGYDNTSIPEGYVQDGESCLGCDGQEHYKIKPNPCDGFMDCGSMGPEIGAKSCQSGNQIKYDNCKACPNLGSLTYCPAPFTCSYEDCSGLYYKTGCQPGYDWNESTKTCTKQCKYKGTLTSCPAPFSCTYEECSGLWYKSGCQSGYDWDAGSQTCTQQCSGSYQYTCSGTGYAGGSGEACNGKYKSCTCTSGYEWKDGVCKEDPKPEWGKCNGSAKNCNIGDILYSDGTCSPQRISGKTSIAVVVYKSADGNCAQAIALNSVGKYIWNSLDWSSIGTDISSLTNFDSDENASKDLNSCTNTQKIIAAGDKSKYPAAWAAHEYKTEGTNAGDWCLPAPGVFTSYYNNQPLVNIGMTNAGGTQIGTGFYNWSSSIYYSYSMLKSFFGVWGSYFGNDYGLSVNTTKNTSYDVRPVLEF